MLNIKGFVIKELLIIFLVLGLIILLAIPRIRGFKQDLGNIHRINDLCAVESILLTNMFKEKDVNIGQAIGKTGLDNILTSYKLGKTSLEKKSSTKECKEVEEIEESEIKLKLMKITYV